MDNSTLASVSAAALGNPEILSLILNKVQSLRDILMAAGVSRLWRSTAHRTYSALELSREDLDPNELNVLSSIRHFTQVTSLHIVNYWASEDTPFFLGGLAAAFPKIRKLCLSVALCSPIGSSHLKSLLKAFPLLERFTDCSTFGLPCPEVLSTLSRIKVLNVALGANLPESFYDLTTLRELNIQNCSTTGLSISPSITRLVNLTKLTAEIIECDALPTRFGVVPSLEVLEIWVMYEVGDRFPLPDLRDLPRLKNLTMVCNSSETQDDGNPPQEPFHLPASLVCLSVDGFPVSSISSWFEGLLSLQRLELRDFPNLKEIPASIGMFKSLKGLVIESCPCLRELPEEVAELQELQYLSVSKNKSLESIPGDLGTSSSLKWLRADQCPKLRRLPWQLEKLVADSENVSIGAVNLDPHA